MILVDTSVRVEHLRAGEPALAQLLEHGRVLTHPCVMGELACGNPRNRDNVLGLLRELPSATSATDEEVLFYIERHRLHGLGIGHIDAHLLTAVSLSDRARLWTRDKRLHACASPIGLISAEGLAAGMDDGGPVPVRALRDVQGRDHHARQPSRRWSWMDVDAVRVFDCSWNQ